MKTTVVKSLTDDIVEKYLTVQQVSELTGYSIPLIRLDMSTKKIIPSGLSQKRKVIFEIPEVERWLNSKKCLHNAVTAKYRIILQKVEN